MEATKELAELDVSLLREEDEVDEEEDVGEEAPEYLWLRARVRKMTMEEASQTTAEALIVEAFGSV